MLKPADETEHHAVVDRIAPSRRYLPATTSLSASAPCPWLRAQPRPVPPGAVGASPAGTRSRLARAAARPPRTVGARPPRAGAPRKLYLKELLQAVGAGRPGRTGPATSPTCTPTSPTATTTVTWLAAMISGLPFSFTGHAKDIYRESLNPAGLLARKLRAAAFVVTCTGANVDHLRRSAPARRSTSSTTGSTPTSPGLGRPARRPRHAAEAPAAAARRERRAAGARRRASTCSSTRVALLRDRGVDVELVIAGETGDRDPAVRELVADARSRTTCVDAARAR